MRWTLGLVLCGLLFNAGAQVTHNKVMYFDDTTTLFGRCVFLDIPDTEASFPGGNAALLKLLPPLKYDTNSCNLSGYKYPFTYCLYIDTLGRVDSVFVARSVCPVLNKVYESTLKQLTFNPATRAGKTVKGHYYVRIKAGDD